MNNTFIKKIDSVNNPRIIAIAKLHNAKERKKQNRFIVEGLHFITEFVNKEVYPVELFIKENLLQDLSVEFLQKLNSKNIPITTVTQAVMKKISTAETPCGFFALFTRFNSPSPDLLTSGIVLANITDPGNMGTLIRSAAAFGYQSVIIIEGCDVYSPKVIQATAGTLAFVTIFQWTWQELLAYKKDLKLYALVLNGTTPLTQIDNKKSLFVVGNEAHGIPLEWASTCEHTITIVMPGNTESLNAAVAGSIVLSYAALH